MFGIDSSELLVVAVLALLFIGPKELPRVLMTVGRWVGQVRGYARHFTSGIENVIREAELEEMERRWREENERIMREFPALEAPVVTGQDLPPPAAEGGLTEPQTEDATPDQRHLPPEQRELP
ncbi:twin-arginine translocase subunit TatB [Sphingomonas piscis]|uniref:Twin-arginine translocase subunit TatB n=1 Tax=Sphingomonas piscis TaxID=2714943 RepID=A0A6G7YR80_9SPHN|nr:Sec-independent protein translocase protein TatB [Sphingomonas piscis]QIK79241.1 twin-arginine translocase subunit TatB [Sphingomonas piscis]